jgi:hypothetical protein
MAYLEYGLTVIMILSTLIMLIVKKSIVENLMYYVPVICSLLYCFISLKTIDIFVFVIVFFMVEIINYLNIDKEKLQRNKNITNIRLLKTLIVINVIAITIYLLVTKENELLSKTNNDKEFLFLVILAFIALIDILRRKSKWKF